LRSRFVFAAAVVVASSYATTARANSFDSFGYDVESASLAGSTMAYGRSLGVLHTNPALLPAVPNQVQVGLSFISPHLYAHLLPKPSSTDVPISIYDSNLGTVAGLQDRALPTVELPNKRGDTNVSGFSTDLAFGLATDLGVKRLRLAGLIQLPLTGGQSDSSVSTHYDDEREAGFSNRVTFTRFGQWDRIVAAVAGVGYDVTSWFSAGVSFQLAAAATARLKIYVPDAAVQSYSQSNMDTKVSISWRPVAGIRLTPLKWATLGVIWRDESYFSVDGTSEVTLWNYHEPLPDKTVLKRSNQSFPIVFGFEPMEVSVALGARRGPVTAQVAATWQRWSTYLSAHHEKPEEAAAFPPSPLSNTTFDTSPYRFHNTVALQSGVSFQLSRAVEVNFGGAYYPSPVPPQTGRTNFVDSSILGLTTGQRFEFKAFGRSFVLALGVQVWRMIERTTNKDATKIVDEFPDASRTLQSNRPMPEAQGLQTNNPGFPGYRAGGYALAGGLSLSYLF
jgi:hypothetical protein